MLDVMQPQTACYDDRYVTMARYPLKRVLITGASGTLGYNVVLHLAEKFPEASLHILMRTPHRDLFGDLPNVTVQAVDMTDTPALFKAVLNVQPTAIIHCAASGVRPSQLSYFDFIELNVSATLELFRASCDVEGCHFVHISTGLVYGSQERPCRESDPLNTLHPYGATKAAADCLLCAGAERLNRHLTIVRPFSFTGLHDGGDRLFPSLLRCAANGTPFRMSLGTQLRDFCAVQDVVDAIALILKTAEPSREIFNVGSGLSLPLATIVRSVVQELALDVEVNMGERPLHALEPMGLVANITRAKSLGWTPRTNLAYAVWQLARSQYPELRINAPERFR